MEILKCSLKDCKKVGIEAKKTYKIVSNLYAKNICIKI